MFRVLGTPPPRHTHRFAPSFEGVVSIRFFFLLEYHCDILKYSIRTAMHRYENKCLAPAA